MSTTTSQPEQRGKFQRLLDWRPASVLARVLIVLTLVVPLLFAATFMWSMWDPSKSLPNVPLAIVNEDEGADNDGEFRTVGDEVVQGVMETDYLNFTEVSAQEAQEGLTKGDYLFVVTIPEDFSSKVVSLISDNPQQSEIRVDYNDYGGTNGTVLTASLIPQLQAQISSTISETYATETLTGMNELGDGIRRAADGSKQIDDGLIRLKDGTTEAVTGIGQLDDGAGELDDGATQLDDGVTELQAGVTELDNGAVELNDGAIQLEDGAYELKDGLLTLKDGTGQLGDGAAQIDGGVQELTGTLIPLLEQVQGLVGQVTPIVDALYSVGMTEQADELNNTISQLDPANPENMVSQLNLLRDGTAELSYNLNSPDAPYLSGVNQLVDGSQQLADGTTQLRDGTGRLVDGTGQLSDGAVQLKDGTTRLKDGTVQLKDGTGQLVDGGAQLDDGVGQLKDGSGELSGQLAEGAEAAPVVSKLDDSARQVAVPILFEETNMHPTQGLVDESNPTVKTIESGFSIVIMLIFGYLVMAVLSALLPHVVGRRKHARTGAGPIIRGFGLMFLINLGVMGVFTAISALTGWSPNNWLAMGVVIGLIAASGAALFQFFRVLFGRLVGGLFSVGFFALGLFVFGGVWPLPTIPAPLQFIHNIHPMSYARDAFMRATDGLLDGTFWIAVVVLLAFIAAALIGSIVIYSARRKGASELEEEEPEQRTGEEPLTSVIR